MVSFENFVKSMPPSLSELKVIPSFCFAFKIPDNVTATIKYQFKIQGSNLRMKEKRQTFLTFLGGDCEQKLVLNMCSKGIFQCHILGELMEKLITLTKY